VEVLDDALQALSGFLASFEPARYNGGDAESLVSVFSALERLAVSGKALAAARAAEARCHLSGGERTPAEWLATRTGDPMGEALDLLKVGEAATSHPGVGEALRRGDLTKHKAKLIVDAVGVNPGAEDEVLKGARSGTHRQVRDACQRAKAEGRSREDEERRRLGLHRSRFCRTFTDTEGAFRLEAGLSPEVGAGVLARLRKETDRLFAAARSEGVGDTPDNYRADALVALVTGETTRRGGSGATPAPPSLHIRVDLEALRRGTRAPGEICEIPGVGPVALSVAEEVLGEALCDLVIRNGVDVTTICHLGRRIPDALRTALCERDPVCCVPGCDVATGLEIDHWAIPVARGGPTSLDNTVRICAHHHDLKTHRGFVLSGGPGHWRFDPPEAPRPPRKKKAKPPRPRSKPPP
jgi:hypothetical protein